MSKRKSHVLSYTCGEHFAPLVAYGDREGLTASEVRAFAGFERGVRAAAPEGYSFTHWDIDTDSHDSFCQCEVTDLYGGCYRFTAVFFRDDDPIIEILGAV